VRAKIFESNQSGATTTKQSEKGKSPKQVKPEHKFEAKVSAVKKPPDKPGLGRDPLAK